MQRFEDDSKLPTGCDTSTADLQQQALDRIVNAVTAQLQDSYDVKVTSFKDHLAPTIHVVKVSVALKNGETKNLVYSVGAFELFRFGNDTLDFVIKNHVNRIVSTVRRVVDALNHLT